MTGSIRSYFVQSYAAPADLESASGSGQQCTQEQPRHSPLLDTSVAEDRSPKQVPDPGSTRDVIETTVAFVAGTTTDSISSKQGSTKLPIPGVVISQTLQDTNCNGNEIPASEPPRKRRKTAPRKVKKGQPVKKDVQDESTQILHQQPLVVIGSLAKCPSPDEKDMAACEDLGKLRLSEESITAQNPQSVTIQRAPLSSGASTSTVQSDKSASGILTTPRKMLKLNAKGTLGSPVAEITSDQKRKGRKSRKSQKDQDTALQNCSIVVLKYGTTSKESKERLGRRIEEILGNLPLVCASNPPSQPARSTPSGPAKPTHPFFLGKAVRNTLSELKQDPSTAMSSSQSDSEHNGPGTSNVSFQKHRPLKIAGSGSNFCNTFTRRVNRAASAIEPLWPPRELMHVRGDGIANTPGGPKISGADGCCSEQPGASFNKFQYNASKRKGTAVRVPEDENVIRANAYDVPNIRLELRTRDSYTAPSYVRIPQRRVLTANEIYRISLQKLSSQSRRALAGKFGMTNDDDSTDDEVVRVRSRRRNPTIHGAIAHVLNGWSYYLSPSDTGKCETLSWLQKYSPTSAEEVLQIGPEAIILRDWLRQLVVVNIDNGSGTVESQNSSKARGKKSDLPRRKKKRQKRTNGLDGFIVDSDEEADIMDELPDHADDCLQKQDTPLKKTVIRTGDLPGQPKNKNGTSRLTNAILLSGPNGCGKTAAVYAAAKELDFEVFELSPGGKRSGKDILEKVGDMTLNHLIKTTSRVSDDPSDASSMNEDNINIELESEKQGSMDIFFKSSSHSQRTTGKRPRKGKSKHNEIDQTRAQQQQQQSLILLEEVDILFDEDKQFWPTVLALIQQSKRPVIMTCNDERTIPIDNLSLHAILRFSPPPEHLAVDYMMLIAAREGHILQRSALEALYKTKYSDLRASISELNFWCQMAVGDTRGGLDWIIDRWPKGADLNEKGEKLRAASVDTYQLGMGWFSQDCLNATSTRPYDAGEELLNESSEFWDFGSEEFRDVVRLDEVCSLSSPPVTKSAKLEELGNFAFAADLLSSCDVWSSPAFRKGKEVIMDTTLPTLSERAQSNFPEGTPLVEENVCFEYSDCGARMAYASFSLGASLARSTSAADESPMKMEQSILEMIIESHRDHSQYRPTNRARLLSAFESIAEPPDPFTASPGRHPNGFDQGLAVLVEDIAPFVRSIVAYDVRLEERRLRLSSLHLKGGYHGMLRTTRTSRAALGDGNLADIRRDRWFSTRVNPVLVLKTGGKGWQDFDVQRSETDSL